MSSRCDACESRAVTKISMVMTEGGVVDFTSCHRCEHKTWRAEGEAVPLDRVLALATRRK